MNKSTAPEWVARTRRLDEHEVRGAEQQLEDELARLRAENGGR